MDLKQKKEMLISSLIEGGILKTKAVIGAFRSVKREEFVLPRYREQAYVDEPLPIMEGQTISQPYTVAVMTEALQPRRGEKILEVGAGSGYQAAVLAEVAGRKGKVITTERIPRLADFAKENLQRAGYTDVSVVNCDGSLGYGREAPYDRIIVTASAPSVPEPLVKQLKAGGILVIPVGDEMIVIKKSGKGEIEKKFIGYYAFVPLVGKYGHKNYY